jgi:AcrR family transcriptional regulator
MSTMAVMSTPTPDRPGLRARKKARTRADIQRAALRLFRQQGYTATTMTQVAEAADVSPSTLFRYFPSKESLVLFDDLDLPILRAFADQPPELSPVMALRAALRNVLGALPVTQRTDLTERLRLLLDLPPVRAALLDTDAGPMGQVVGVVASRVGRPTDDFEVRTVVGALSGTIFAALIFAAQHPNTDPLELVDAALSRLDTGFRP